MQFRRHHAHIAALPLLVDSSSLVTQSALAQVAAPKGPHPRLWLDAATVKGLSSAGAKSAVAKGAARCTAARTTPSEYVTGGWQGFEWVLTLSGCMISYKATGNADD